MMSEPIDTAILVGPFTFMLRWNFHPSLLCLHFTKGVERNKNKKINGEYVYIHT